MCENISSSKVENRTHENFNVKSFQHVLFFLETFTFFNLLTLSIFNNLIISIA